MKGSLRRPPDPERKHLIKDYRDPVPRALPSLPKYKMREKPDLDSVIEIRSNDEIWDRLRDLKLLRRNRYTSVAELKDRQRAIILSLPQVGERELRRLKLAAHEYVPLELEEDGYHLASVFLQHFLRRHDAILSSDGPRRTEEAPLRQQPQMIALLAKLFRQLDAYVVQGDLQNTITLSLNCAVFFEKKKVEWWWMAEEFYKIAKEVCSLITNDFGYSQAVIHYMFGKFLLLKLKSQKEAIDCLSKAWALSKGKIWNVEWLTGVQDESIAECSRTLCYIAYLAAAEALCYEDPDLAMEKAQEAIRIAYRGTEMREAMFDYATYALQAEKLAEAHKVLSLILEKCKKGQNLDMYLSVQFLLVECFMREDQPEKARETLVSIAVLGTKIKVPWLKALAFRYLGQIHLQMEDKETALNYLTLAIKINKLDNIHRELAICEYLIGCCQFKEDNDT